MSIPTSLKDVLIFSLFMVMVYLFFFGDEALIHTIGIALSADGKAVFVLFLGIFLEALPFLLLGAFASSVINIFVSEKAIAKLIPKNPVAGILMGLVAAVITPVCECAIIPVVRRLIQKGVPLHVGVVLLMGAPILNFIVFGSTFFAFQNHPAIIYGRFIVCILAAIIVSACIYLFFGKDRVLKTQREDLMNSVQANVNKGDSKWKGILHHTCHEFFTVGKFFMIGALFASVAQLYLQGSAFVQAAQNTFQGTAVMMGLAYLLSLCSEADAFVAASFSKIFSSHAILGFLVFGPILDFKNTFVMLASFKIKFVVCFIMLVTIAVFALSIIVGSFLV
ncbi:permease [Niallia sp. NCCP-28]|uniref:permease n=1 Tax=Niallia sp. NCCP-28 TaxID=2934712 RepID=UPI0020862252|nr:permease [Niallia sp. NCCP-28]GKU80768.1 permease [Niallia sp. NCCP-28]